VAWASGQLALDLLRQLLALSHANRAATDA
jgi:hypothetical protein